MAALGSTSASSSRDLQQARWQSFYNDQKAVQLRNVAGHIRRRRSRPDLLRAHFQTCLTLLDHTAQETALSPLWLDLVDALHPLPEWWGKWEEWLQVLRLAAEKCAARNEIERRAGYLGHAASLLLHMGPLSEALFTAEQTLILAHRAQYAPALGEAGRVAVSCYRAHRRTAKAAELLSTLQGHLAQWHEIGRITGYDQARALLDLEQMDLERHDGNLADAVALADDIVDRARKWKHADRHALAMIYRRRATIYWASCRYEDAAVDLTNSAALFREEGDELAAVFSEGNLGLVYYSMSRYELAAATILKTIVAEEKLNARWRLTSDIGNLTGVYIARGEMAAAVPYARRHLDLALLADDSAEIFRANANYAMVLVYLGRAAEGHELLEKSVPLAGELNRSESVIASKVDLAICHAELSDRTTARALAEEAYEAAMQLDYPVLKIITTRCLAHFMSGAAAQSLLQDALALSREHGRKLDEAGCLLSLASLQSDPAAAQALWQEGARLLHDIGAEAWIDGKSPENPPWIAMIL